MTEYSIFIVDDEKTIREGISSVLSDHYRTTAFKDAESVLTAVTETAPDLILLDIGLPGISGLEALERIKAVRSDILVIMITAYEDIASVVTAMKTGAYDYIVKPIHMDSLERSIENALQTITLRKEIQTLQEASLKENLPFFIGKSNAIQHVMEFISLVAKSPDTPILILGETGTGKELIARAIHYRSPNFKGPLISMNCAAIPAALIESELFGYEKGAFTGARTSGKRGLIEEARNGTLFLDEVGDLSLEAQAKLLRFLEEGEFYRIGSTEKQTVQTRIISATNKDLEQMAGEGTFRRDLFYRLSVITVTIPSLNQRREDIEPLANSFVLHFAEKFGKRITGISSEVMEAMQRHRWTGNIRELRNMIERAVLVSHGSVITLQDAGLAYRDGTESKGPDGGPPLLPPLTQSGVDFSALEAMVETYYFDAALRLSGGNESGAARLLNLNHHTFRYRRKAHPPSSG
ncbi:sigma-54-dependent Fis family transcriptional regulator [bacterium]|nr:sigma-54-dependent Fis family transcriptional regulator [bacterium]